MRIGALIGHGYGQTVTAVNIDQFVEMTTGMYGAQGYELVIGFGPEECEGAVKVELAVKINGPNAFLGWNGELYAVEPGRPVPDYIEVDMVAEIDRVESFKVENNEGEIVNVTRQCMTVSREAAMTAIRDYVATGSRPTSLDWRPLSRL